MSNPPIENTLQKALRDLRLATALLFVGLAALTVWNWNTGRNAQEIADRNLGALCALRGDLEKRVSNSKDFLIEHPNGIPGITPRLIKDGIENQARTIKALGPLAC